MGNCSGFYGDRLSAMREMVEGGELDVLTGDYLAELTMLILGRDRKRHASLGYAKTFVRQVEDTLGLALEQGRGVARRREQPSQPLGDLALVAEGLQVPVGGAEALADPPEAEQPGVRVGGVGEPLEHRR